jgi:Protein of unknown function (DUF1552)
MSFSLARRRLLTAAGGSVLLRTLLGSFDAHAQSVPKKRIVFVTTVWGTAPRYFTSPSWTTSQFPLRDMLLPLAPYQAKLNIINNLNVPAAGSGLHGNPGLFTGTDALIPAGSTKGQKPQGSSVDQFIASSIGANDAFPSVVLADTQRGSNSFDQQGNAVSALIHAGIAFQTLFGAVSGTPGSVDPTIARRQRLLDYTRGEIRALQSRLVGSEKVKLDGYLNGVDDLQKQLMPRPVGTISCATPTAPMLPPAPTGGSTQVTNHAYAIANAEAQFGVLAQALICGLTRVGFMNLSAIPPALNYAGYASPGGNVFAYHHDAQHGGNIQRIEQQNTFWFELMANFWKLLEAAPEGAGSVADNTLLVWMPGSGEHHGGSYNIPALVLGNLKGTIQSGRHLRYAPDNDFKNKSPNTPNDFFTSLCNVLGAPVAKFGDSRYCSGPLPQFV